MGGVGCLGGYLKPLDAMKTKAFRMNKMLQVTLNNVMLIFWQQKIWLDKTEEMRDECED
jgi:hypothetical protein